MRTAGRIAESGILTKNRLSEQNARTACLFLLTPPGTGIQPSFPDGFRPHSPGKPRTSSWCNPPRTLPDCKRHGGAGRGAHFRQRSGQQQQNHHQQGNQFPHGFLQGGSFGERGYLVATMKGYTICAMDASTHFLLARHFLVTGGGGFAARAKEKHRFYRTDANLAES